MQGLIVLNKPKGITSFGAIAALRKLTGQKRIGHTGTLDPLASGVLICLIGRPCVLSDFIMHSEKSYIASITLGYATDSYDVTGQITSKSDIKISKEQLLKVLSQFLGESLQLPPMFSAKKSDGKRLYELAREGKIIERTPNKIFIKKLELLSFDGKKAEISVTCSKGTYISSLVHDIGLKLGSFATMTELERISNGPFNIENAVALAELNENNIENYIINPEVALLNYKKIEVTEKQATRFYNGGELDISRLKFDNISFDEIVRVNFNGNFIGMGKLTPLALKVICPINKP